MNAMIFDANHKHRTTPPSRPRGPKYSPTPLTAYTGIYVVPRILPNCQRERQAAYDYRASPPFPLPRR